MARTSDLNDFLTDVASAIKTKKGSQTDIQASDFDTEILALPAQGTYQHRTVNITSNGTQRITPEQGYDAIDQLDIVTNVTPPIKLFTTQALMQADTDPHTGDKAVVYRYDTMNCMVTSQFNEATFPDTVVLSEGLDPEDNISIRFSAVDTNHNLDFNGYLSYDYFFLSRYRR